MLSASTISQRSIFSFYHAVYMPQFGCRCEASIGDGLLDSDSAGHASLTPRELEVLAATADGVSNKAIARRLGISFHTAKCR
jgi:DNA-binding NarL/FixJ family response regulator